MSEIEAVIKRLMKYCKRANKEVIQSIERRKLVMDIEMIYSGLMEIMEQRDAALELADRLDRFADYRETDVGASEYEQGESAAYRESAKYLRAVLKPKDEK